MTRRADTLAAAADKVRRVSGAIVDTKYRMWRLILPFVIIGCLAWGTYDLVTLLRGGLDAVTRDQTEAAATTRLVLGLVLLPIWFFLFRRKRAR